MAAPGPERSRGPHLEATDARGSRPAPGAFLMLAVSTVAGLIAVAVIWALFAGPLHHATSKPQVSSPSEASTVHQAAPAAKVADPSSGAGPASGGTGPSQ
jgi:hypothetical protein